MATPLGIVLFFYSLSLFHRNFSNEIGFYFIPYPFLEDLEWISSLRIFYRILFAYFESLFNSSEGFYRFLENVFVISNLLIIVIEFFTLIWIGRKWNFTKFVFKKGCRVFALRFSGLRLRIDKITAGKLLFVNIFFPTMVKRN